MTRYAPLLLLLTAGCARTPLPAEGPPWPTGPVLVRKFTLTGVTGPADDTGIAGRLDHMAYDPAAGRLYVAGLAHGSLQVIDLRAGARAGSVNGLEQPQGVGVGVGPGVGRVYVATGKDGRVRAFDARSLNALGSAPVGDDADNVRVAADGTVWISFGGPGPGGLASFDPLTLAPGPVVKSPRMPEGFRLDPAGGRAFVNLPAGKRSAADGSVVALKLPGGEVLWETKLVGRAGNFPMAYDADRGRVFIATRRPAYLIALDAADGKVLGECECPAESDDLFYDAPTKRVAVLGGGSPPTATGPGGVGASLDLFALDGDGRPTRVGSNPLPPHARTGAHAPDLRLIFVGVPATAESPAEVREYRLPAPPPPPH